MKSINVLMSTYNGSRYLKCQIDSILSQQGVDVHLIVRDDHSTDDTASILGTYAQAGQLSFTRGENVGPARSFMSLLGRAQHSDYYAFSDQDDYWEPDKLVSAIARLEPHGDKPALYLGQTRLVDSELNPISYVPVYPLLTFGESLVYEFAAGCTMVMNKALRDIIVSHTPSYLKMHDVWVYSVSLAIGAKVVFDPVPHIKYRQHSSNAVGQGYGKAEEWRRRIMRLLSKERSRSARAREIEKGFWDIIPAQNRELLSLYVEGKKSLIKRCKLLTDKRLRCSNPKVSKYFKLSLLLNQY